MDIRGSPELLNRVSAPMIDIYGRVIACDNKIAVMIDPLDADHDQKSSNGLPNSRWRHPFSPILTEDRTVIIATDRGPIYALDSSNGTLLAVKYLIQKNQSLHSFVYLGITIRVLFNHQHPCTRENRFYVSTHYKNLRGVFALFFDARLYAIDVDGHNPDPDQRLQIAWHRTFGGPSGASPP